MSPLGACLASAVRSPSVRLTMRSTSLRSDCFRIAGGVRGSRPTSRRSCQPSLGSASQAKCRGQRGCLTTSCRTRREVRTHAALRQPLDQDAGAARPAQQPGQLPFAGFPSGVQELQHRRNFGVSC